MQELLAEIDKCVKCGLCLAVCPTYQLFRNEADSPRGRLALIAQGTPNKKTKKHLDSCLLCRRCEHSCPSMVSITDTILSARNNSLSAWQQLQFRSIELSLTSSLIAPILRLSYKNKTTRGERRSTSTSHPITDQNLLLLEGCATQQLSPHTRDHALQLLSACGYNCDTPTQSLCCGAVHRHQGNTDKSQQLTTQLTATQKRKPYFGVTHLISGCNQYINHLGLDFESKDISYYLYQQKHHLKFSSANQLHVGIHQSCSLSPTDTKNIQTLIQLIPDINVYMLSNALGCCGAAGSFMLTQRNTAKQLRQPIIEDVEKNSCDIVISNNIACASHLQSGLTGTPVVHLVDFLHQFIR